MTRDELLGVWFARVRGGETVAECTVLQQLEDIDASDGDIIADMFRLSAGIERVVASGRAWWIPRRDGRQVPRKVDNSDEVVQEALRRARREPTLVTDARIIERPDDEARAVTGQQLQVAMELVQARADAAPGGATRGQLTLGLAVACRCSAVQAAVLFDTAVCMFPEALMLGDGGLLFTAAHAPDGAEVWPSPELRAVVQALGAPVSLTPRPEIWRGYGLNADDPGDILLGEAVVVVSA